MRNTLYALTTLALLAAPAAPVTAAPAEDLLTSMEVSLVECYNVTSTGTNTQREVMSNLGIVQPQMGSSMAFMLAGDIPTVQQCNDTSPGGGGGCGTDPITGATLYDCVSIEMDCDVPKYANSLGFSFYFFSREYPDYVGSNFNDTFQVYLTSAAWNGNIVFDAAGNVISVNNALFTVTNPALLQGTGFDCQGRGGGTGWLTTIAPVISGETIHIKFETYDMSDGIYDSGVLIDDLYWSEQNPDSPTTGKPIEVWYLSPKEGPIAGGQEVTVYGKNFTVDANFFFENEQVQTTLIDSGRMTIITPEWSSAETIDVLATNDDFDYKLEGAYTYREEESEGEYPPEFYLIDPGTGPDAGGITVEIQGMNFWSGAIAYFDGVQATTTFVSSEMITAVIPPHEAGVVEVVVFNPDDQYTDPTYFFTYYDDGGGDDDEGGDDDDGGNSGDCSCDAAARPAAGTAALLALAGLLAVRRRA